MKPNNALLLLLMLISSNFSFAQLPDFSLSVSSEAQTCLGNGSLQFTVSGTQPGAVMAYEIFLLPNTTTPVATVNTATAPNLIAGNYLVVATQTLGNESNTASANVTIDDEVVPLSYTLATSTDCDGDGSITVSVVSGNASTYEIMAGPVTVPQQASNVFDGLTAGLYQVRVYDDCGDAVVVSVQLEALDSNLLIQSGQLVNQIGCEEIVVQNYFWVVAGEQIYWPLTFVYTVFPPGGGASESVTIEVTGGEMLNIINAELPFYIGQYSYNIQVTDACGNVFTENNNVVNTVWEQSWELHAMYDPCALDEIQLNTFSGISFPVTVDFLESPIGFDPEALNPEHPVFDTAPFISYHIPGQLLPVGVYKVMLTDACGRQIIEEISASVDNPSLVLEPLPGNCGNGGIRMCMAGKDAVVKEMTSGPPEFSGTYPVNLIGELQENGDIDLHDLPPGGYTIHIIDECGFEHSINFTIVSLPGFEPQIYQLPGCVENYGSVNIDAGEYTIAEGYIVEAPATYTQALPFNIYGNMSNNGELYMNSLPEGDYTFGITTECGLFLLDYTVLGYEVYENSYQITPHCGSFDLFLAHSSNNQNSYWLQRYDEETGTWGHPGTGVAFDENGLPGPVNSVELQNYWTNINLAYTGTFRILKFIYVYGNGDPILEGCYSIIQEFTFTGAPDILAAYSFPCDDNTAEVALVAEGIPPLSYSITNKNGQPFVVNNGASPHFTSLETGVYNFQVTDDCGNIRNIVFDINTLDPLEIQPEGFCDGQDSSLLLPDFAFLEYEWWEQSAPGTILGTNHNLLFPAFDPETEAGTYLVHITSTNPGSCIDLLLEHVVTPNDDPAAGPDSSAAVCNDGTDIDLTDYLVEPFDENGTWADVNNSGGLEGSLLSAANIAPGSYQYTYTVTSVCGLSDQAVISLEFKAQPESPSVNQVGGICQGTVIQLEAADVAGAAYQWQGPGGYNSNEQNPIIENAGTAQAGTYFVTITVPGTDCPSIPAAVAVEVEDAPQFTIEGNSEICIGQTTELSVAPLNFDPVMVTYQWYLGGELVSTVASFEVSEPGTYEVVVNAGGCSASQEFVVNSGSNAFELLLEAGCLNFDYTLQVLNFDEIPGATVSWTGPEGFTASESSVVITDFAAGDYIATVTNWEGCPVTAVVTVDNTSCFIPRGISPNGDGDNDSFDISNLEARYAKIFNRYGMLVYEQENYTNEWNGQSGTQELPTGTYYYMITLSAGKQVTGWVYLQREE